MKRILLLLLLIVPSAVVGQSKAPASLELGKLRVWLGMSKSEMLSAAAKLGYRVNEHESSGYIMIWNNGDGGFNYSVRFKHARLVYATRSWRDGQGDPWKAMMGALSSVEQRTCQVHRSHSSEPGFDYDAYIVDCGERSVYVEESVSGDGVRVTDVGEVIGHPNGDS